MVSGLVVPGNAARAPLAVIQYMPEVVTPRACSALQLAAARAGVEPGWLNQFLRTNMW